MNGVGEYSLCSYTFLDIQGGGGGSPDPSVTCRMAFYLFRLLLAVLLTTFSITAADPDPLQDFCVADNSSSTIFMNGLPCLNPTKVTVQHFMTSDLGTPGNTAANPLGFSAKVADAVTLPGLNTLGLYMVRADVAVGGIVPPHTHPRATEMVFIVRGRLNSGFVDTSNRLFAADLKAGDVFVIPRAMIHYHQNIGSTPVLMIVTSNSQNPGISVVHQAVFAANGAIPKEVISKSFNITFQEVEKIRKGLGGS